MKKKILVTPTLHLNGTSGQVLLKQYADAGRAVGEAIRKLSEAAPHERDYYVDDKDGSVFRGTKAAFEEHIRRLHELEGELMDVCGDILMQIEAQEDAKAARK